MVDLKEVVRQAKESGLSKKEIREELENKGYSKGEIDSAFGDSNLVKKTRIEDLDYWEKIKLLFSNPIDFFDKVRDVGIGKSLLFIVLIGLLYLALLFTFTIIFPYLGGGFSRGYVDFLPLIGSLLFLPLIFSVIGTFIYSGISHLIVKWMGGKGSWVDSFNVVAYSFVPAALLLIIPLVGWLSFIYAIVLMVFGFAKYHGISKGKAVVPALVPILAVFVLLFLFILYLWITLSRIF